MDLEWQGEIEALLAALEVSMGPEVDLVRDPALLMFPDVEHDMVPEEASALGDEITAIRVEVEATLARVLALSREGRIDLTTRDDIILVFRALLQPRGPLADEPIPLHGEYGGGNEWEFASAATVLRFCRLILYLAQSVA